jgi:hypothetical protein
MLTGVHRSPGPSAGSASTNRRPVVNGAGRGRTETKTETRVAELRATSSFLSDLNRSLNHLRRAKLKGSDRRAARAQRVGWEPSRLYLQPLLMTRGQRHHGGFNVASHG